MVVAIKSINVKFHISFLLLFILLTRSMIISSISAWSNGGYSEDPSNPDYGTHDWIAEHALAWLPTSEKQYIVDNLPVYLYGTELPDNGGASDGIGDTTKHHIYFYSDETLQDDSAAERAESEYYETLNYLKSGDLESAAKNAGIMSHYIVDMAVFGHVMGSDTDWGSESHHSDYEQYVNSRTNSYNDDFNSFLSFDGDLSNISAYNASFYLAYDTTFDTEGELTCVWMDQNYDWADPVFKNRCGESINLAVNYLADVLYSLYVESGYYSPQNSALDVVINEVELNPPGNDNYNSVEEWVELFNPTTTSINIGGWRISTTHGETVTVTIPQGTRISANGYYVYGRGSQWLDNDDESVVLRDSSGSEVDRTPAKSDGDNDSRSWQRYPNGQSSWSYRTSTKGSSNGGTAPSDTTPPTITNAQINPGSGPAGTVFQVSARVSDSSGVSSVTSYIQKPDENNIATVTMVDPESDGTYTGSWNSRDREYGTYWVDIVARDNRGNSRESENLVSFTILEAVDEEPNAFFTYSPTHNLSIFTTINFEDISSDPDGDIVSWHWDFGDSYTSSIQNPTHKYNDRGAYSVQLNVTDDDGLSDSTSREITILNLSPNAKFSYSPSTPEISQVISFIDSSADPEGKGLSYLWNFDDGFTSFEKNPSHTYETPGSYTVKLTVTDDEGTKDTVSKEILIERLSCEITCTISPSEVTQDSSITVSGSINPTVIDKNVILTFTKPDNSTSTFTLKTGSDGSYSYTYTPKDVGPWSVSASWYGNSTHQEATSSEVEFTVIEKSGCFIATATYGSELSPEVQFLRGFRDNMVLNTFAGSSFMTVFNEFYYAFSPSVASVISNKEALKMVMRVALYPLIGILQLSSEVCSLFTFNPELGVIIAGLMASSLIALVYITPSVFLLCFMKNFKLPSKILHFMSFIWFFSIIALLLAKIIMFPLLMMIATGLFVFVTMSITCLITLRGINRVYYRHKTAKS